MSVQVNFVWQKSFRFYHFLLVQLVKIHKMLDIQMELLDYSDEGKCQYSVFMIPVQTMFNLVENTNEF